MTNTLKQQEKRFIEWAESRDDDWWEHGNGHITIWDFRIFQEFMNEEIKKALQDREKVIIEMLEGEKMTSDDGYSNYIYFNQGINRVIELIKGGGNG